MSPPLPSTLGSVAKARGLGRVSVQSDNLAAEVVIHLENLSADLDPETLDEVIEEIIDRLKAMKS